MLIAFGHTRAAASDSPEHTPPGESETSAAASSSPAVPITEPGQSLGEMIQCARLARGLLIDDLARAELTARGYSFPTAHALKYWTERFLGWEQGGTMLHGEIEFAARALGVSSQESDRWYARAGFDLTALILANPSKLDAVRALLTGGSK